MHYPLLVIGEDVDLALSDFADGDDDLNYDHVRLGVEDYEFEYNDAATHARNVRLDFWSIGDAFADFLLLKNGTRDLAPVVRTP